MTIRPFNGVMPRIGEGAYVDPSALVVGEVTLGRDVSVWPGCVVRGDVNAITIGNETNIQDGCVLHVGHRGESDPNGHPLVIGAGVTVGHRAVLHGCTIGELCLIGIGAIVLDGAVIEDRVMIGAGSLVPPGKTLKSGSLYLGSPARAVRELTAEELAFLPQSRDGYVRLKREYQGLKAEAS